MITKRYNKYKKVGGWLNEVPQHWRVERIKNIFDQVSNKGTELKPGTYIPLENIQSYTGKLLTTSTNENNEETILFKRGDLLFMKLRPYLAKVLITEFDGGVSGEVIVNRIRRSKSDKIWSRYYFYRFLSSEFITKVNSMTDGVKMPRVNPSKICALDIAVPQFDEQVKIAKYLDKKTALIDDEINLLEAKMAYYSELSKSVVNETVTKGLNHRSKLKQGNTAWIDKIPTHWKMVRGKILFTETSKKGHPELPLLAASQKMGVVLKSMLKSRSMEAQKDFENFKVVEIDDFVISLRSFEGGIETAFYKGIISPVYSVFKGNEDINVTYFKHLFKCSSFISHLKTMVTGIRDGQSIKFVEIQNTFFPLPPYEEQEEIGEYLDIKTKAIDEINTTIQLKIESLKEFRKTIINAAASGSLKVT